MHNGFQYRFGYDTFRNVNNIKVADWNNSQSQTLMEKTFYPANGPLKTQTYGDGFKLRYGYNKDGQVTKVYKTPKNLTETLACENIYNKNGELVYLKDLENNLLTEYQYDFTGRVTGKDVKDAATGEGSGCLSQRVGYDDKDRVSSLVQRLKGGTAVKSTYLYGDASKGEEPGLIYGMSVDGTQKETLTYDPIGRIVKRTFLMENGNNWETEYTYVKGNASYQGASTLLVESVKDPDKILFYTYDAVGNITQIHEQAAASGQKELKVTYEYDSLGQLIRENNKWLNETIVYAYDSGGNMQSKEVYTYTTGTPSTKKNAQCATLTYGNYWKDQLTKFQYTNGAEQNIEYTDGGNPYLYRNLALTWKDGRKLSQVKNGETVIASYTYDQNGIRIKKTVGSNVTNFHTDGGKILVMEKDGKEVHFIYDQDGSLFSMKVVNGTTVTDYYYEKNLQGDVVGLIDSSGAKKVNYMYDSWGRPVNMTDESGTGAGSLNPFRYRGYFYDEETGWYYLKSRYYDPEVGRFINADTIDVLTVSLVTLTDKNLYAYCDNNPLVRKDQEGNIWLTAMVIGFGVGIAFQYVGDVISNKKEGKTGKDVFEIRSSGMDYLASGVGGAIAAIPGLNFVGTVAVGAAGNVLADGMKGNINNFEDAVESATWGAFANAVGYGVSKLVAKGIVNKVNNMTRTSQKTYINQKLYRGSQAMVNSNYHDFMLKNTKGKVAAVERAIGPLRSGIYSTLTSTMTGLFRR